MANKRSRPRSASSKRAAKETRTGWFRIVAVAVVGIAIIATYILVARGNRSLDDETLCPANPASITVLLVDVTDPMTVAQRQDFQNQLVELRNAIPRYGKLVVVKVDTAATSLLRPVIARCNPGTAKDANEWTGDPKGLDRKHREGFVDPLSRVFEGLSQETGSDRSPILESIQSVALTELLPPDVEALPRKLIVASDLLQNTEAVSFYSGLPDPDAFIASSAFRRARTNLRDVDVELWMLERSDAPQTQPRALPNLWEAIIGEQGGDVERTYRVSG